MTRISQLPQIQASNVDGSERTVIVKGTDNFSASIPDLFPDALKTYNETDSFDIYPENWDGSPLPKNTIVGRDGVLLKVKKWPWTTNIQYLPLVNREMS